MPTARCVPCPYPMIIALGILAVVVLASGFALVAALRQAPLAHEDETGFRVDSTPETSTEPRSSLPDAGAPQSPESTRRYRGKSFRTGPAAA